MPKATLLNVDLEVRSATALDVLAAALGDEVVILYNGRVNGSYLLSAEIVDTRRKTANSIIRKFAALIAALPAKASRAWKQAGTRTFDIGMQAGTSRSVGNVKVSETVVKSVAKLGATLAFTVYPAEPNQPSPPN